MSNIDKQSVQAVADLKAGYTLGHADVAILNDLARIALASLEAEPVADEHYKNLSELYHAQEKRLFKLAQRIKGPSFDKYAHSPSQAIDVLELAIFGEREDGARRAAMLQGADGNSPVLPDGWVDCSERMPEGMVDVITSNGFDTGKGWWDGDNWKEWHKYDAVPGKITHWMPMPAAPQQEVK